METPEETRKCPDCSRDVKAGAKFCHFCGRVFDPEAVQSTAQFVTGMEKPERRPDKTRTSIERGGDAFCLGLVLMLAGGGIIFGLTDYWQIGLAIVVIGAILLVFGFVRVFG